MTRDIIDRMYASEVELLCGPRFEFQKDLIEVLAKDAEISEYFRAMRVRGGSARHGVPSFVVEEMPVAGPIIRLKRLGGFRVNKPRYVRTVRPREQRWYAKCLTCLEESKLYVRPHYLKGWAHRHRCPPSTVKHVGTNEGKPYDNNPSPGEQAQEG